jgi:hypothetical protein
MSQNSFLSGGLSSTSFFQGLSADELTLNGSALNNTSFNVYYTNSLTSSNTGPADFWNNIYPVIFTVNSAIQGLTGASQLTPAVGRQLLGEAMFMRAFCYFYLVNLYGDVPLVTSTAYTTNSNLARTPQIQVYHQIISDLKNADTLLSGNYLDATLLNTTLERVRPTSWAASALLARAYLYNKNWDSAIMQSTTVIDNSGLFSLDTLNGVFFANSTEAIWQLQPTISGENTPDAWVFIIPSSGPDEYNYPVYLSNSLLNSFEPGDQRWTDWVDSTVVGGTAYYYPFKYKSATLNASVTEYEMVMRLGEQYLIRAEAEAELNDFTDADSDVNVIRGRAGLAGISLNDQPSLLTAILHERQVELFTEWGHRWADLKRFGNAAQVLSATKGFNVPATQLLYPIPLYDIQHDLNLVQNPGY